MTRLIRSLAALALTAALAACGGGSKTSSGTTTAAATTPADPKAAAASALAAKLGVSEAVVNAGLAAAQSALGAGSSTGTPASDYDRTAAAQAGLDKASAQATAEGKPLSDDQKSGLLEGLKGLL